MARLRIRVEMNKGRVGVPLEKLAGIAADMQKFLKMLTDDINIGGGEWLGIDFSNGSLNFNAEYIKDVPVRAANTFNRTFDDVRRGKPTTAARTATRLQYAQIAENLDLDEQIDFGIYKTGNTDPEIFPLSRSSVSVLVVKQEPVESYASLQGKIHSVFLGSIPRHFVLRELSTETLIHCEYPTTLHGAVAKVIQDADAVVHVYGLSRIDLVARKIDRLQVERVEKAEKLTEEDFERFFGCAPTLTGKESTQQFINRVRQRNGDAA